MAEQAENQIDFTIQKIFTADMSFESPHTPAIFKDEWKPDANIDLQTDSEKLDDTTYTVTLGITTTVKNQGKTAFLVEVKQTGIFTISGVDEENLPHLVGAFCPSILFPYAREVISNLVTRGGFPELNLSPVNFDAMFAEQQAKAAAE
jgi:preprotein translocase subunit SecB